MATVNYSQSFDGLPNGDLVPQDSWYLGGGFSSPIVQDVVACEGTKAVKGSTTVIGADRDFAGINGGVHWQTAYMRTSSSAQSFPFFLLGKASTNYGIIYGGTSAFWKAYDGDGVGGGVWVSTGVPIAIDTCFLFKVRMDIPNKKWDIYVEDMDTPKLTDLGFVHNTADSLNWIRMQFSNPSHPSVKYIDGIIISGDEPEIVGRRLLSQGLNNNPLLSGRLN